MSYFNNIFKREGYQCLYEKETAIFENVDRDFVAFLKEHKYIQYTIPAMIDTDILKKCNYFESFPQHLSVIATVKEDSLSTVSNSKCICLEDIQLQGKILTPAACLHIYPMLENQEIDQKIITTRAKVYRYEGNRYNEIGRFWDYTVREIVFVGSSNFVRSMLIEFQKKALEYALKITANAKLIPATDIFFNSKRNSIKRKLQIANEKKYELIIPIDGEDVAVSSFNFHGNHFSMPFSFDRNNTVVSGCVGFGLERWLLAKLFYEGEKNE